MNTYADRIPVVVTEVEQVATLIKRFRFRARDGHVLPRFSGGAHVVVEMRDKEETHRNPYSLMGSLDDHESYQISVRLADQSRGGSAFMHSQVKIGTELRISQPVNLFALNWQARKHLLVAGGIGITPFIAQLQQLDQARVQFELHYCVRSEAQGAYWRHLADQYGQRVRIYLASRNELLALDEVLAGQPLGTHLYVCGPGPMIDWALSTGRQQGWHEENLHSEQFQAPPTGKPFAVTLQRSAIKVSVGEHTSLLEAIEAAGVDAPYLCRGGACGSCEVGVVSHDGRLIHNDHYLTDDEKRDGMKILPCVSRFEGQHLVLDL